VKPAAFTIRGIFGHLARLRFINISPDATVELMLAENRVPTRWISVANDGADLPPPLRVERVAKLRFSAGQTYDFLWTPASRGTQLSTSTVTTCRIMPAKEPLSLASQFEAWFGFGITVIGVVFLFLCNREVRGKDYSMHAQRAHVPTHWPPPEGARP
jgi:hypothetical protein